MTQALATSDRYLTDFRDFERSLAAEQPHWIRKLRRDAWGRFAEIGFPTARKGNEPWKYTSVLPIAEAEFASASEAKVGIDEVRRVVPWDESWTNIVFVNGRHAQGLSTESAASHVTDLAEAVTSSGDLLEKYLARSPVAQEDAFVALNTAFLRDGAFVHVPQDESPRSPLHLVFVTTGGDERMVTYPRVIIVAGANSRLTVIESYVSLSPAGNLTDAVTEIVLEDGARVEHYRLLMEGENAYHVGASRVRLVRDSSFSSVSFQRGLALGRHDLRVLLDGPGCECYLNGLYVTTGREHVDNYISIDHAKPHATSRLRYRGILDGRSHAVFGGTVLVRPDAVKTDAHQEDKNLILSEEAEVDSKPGLEIYADDVKCGHGATAGTVAEDALFYMQSRGLDLETATGFLVRGFASAITDGVRERTLRSFMEDVTAGALQGVKFGRAS